MRLAATASGWRAGLFLRGGRGDGGGVATPTMEEEDARRLSRERESLVDERSRITMKSALARLGIRGFKPHLRKAPERLAGLRQRRARACRQTSSRSSGATWL